MSIDHAERIAEGRRLHSRRAEASRIAAATSVQNIPEWERAHRTLKQAETDLRYWLANNLPLLLDLAEAAGAAAQSGATNAERVAGVRLNMESLRFGSKTMGNMWRMDCVRLLLDAERLIPKLEQLFEYEQARAAEGGAE